MNCWVCGGHGHIVTVEQHGHHHHHEESTQKEAHVPHNISQCHYCAGSGFIEMEE